MITWPRQIATKDLGICICDRITSSDTDDVYAIYSNPDVMRYMDRLAMTSKDQALHKIKDIQTRIDEKLGINWAVRVEGKVVGVMGIWRIDYKNHRGEVGYVLHPDYWRQGITRACLRWAISYGFDEMGIHSYMANINPANEASRNLLLGLHFKKEAYHREDYYHDGKYYDSEILGLIKSEWKT